MTRGQRTITTLLAVVAVLLGLNLIVGGSPRAVAQDPEIRLFPEPPEPTVVAGVVDRALGVNTVGVWRFWSDGQVDWALTQPSFNPADCLIEIHCDGPPIVVIP